MQPFNPNDELALCPGYNSSTACACVMDCWNSEVPEVGVTCKTMREQCLEIAKGRSS